MNGLYAKMLDLEFFSIFCILSSKQRYTLRFRLSRNKAAPDRNS